jgi:glycosyltransferase involved in cell wall biosynthesis
MDIIVVGQQAWDIEIGSNCKNIALEFSNLHRVLYVNPPLDRITVLRNKGDAQVSSRLKMMAKKETIMPIAENLWNLFPDSIIESINWIKFDFVYDFFNKINNKRFARSIKKAAMQLGFKDYILFNDSDMFRSFYLKELLQPKMAVYYSRDYFLANDYYKFHGAKLEPLLINKSNVCVANSQFLTNYCKKYNPNSYYVGQGCDISLFTDATNTDTPNDMRNIKGPVIGYVGVLYTMRLDLEILFLIADSNPAWQLVLVGPEDEQFAASKLHHLPNVHFLGAKAPEELPAYINAFDVCINPQILNDFTNGNYPRKVDEYLAMGKPVVLTKTDAIAVFEDFVFKAETKSDYPVLITRALAEDNIEKRQQRKDFVAGHTWKNNVKEIYDAINQSQGSNLQNHAVQN